MKRVVYFVKPVGMEGPIKIGSTRNFTKRFRCMNTDSPFELECILWLEGDYDDETKIQTLLLGSHLRGSWFQASDEVLALIERVKRVGISGMDLATENRSPRSKIWRAYLQSQRAVEQDRAAA